MDAEEHFQIGYGPWRPKWSRASLGSGPASAASTPENIVERSFSERQVKLLEFTPWLVQKNKGPANAKGVVYFIAGSAMVPLSVPLGPSQNFSKTLSENGWDVIEAKQPKDQTDSFSPRDDLDDAAVFLNRRVNELKAEGYKRVLSCRPFMGRMGFNGCRPGPWVFRRCFASERACYLLGKQPGP